MKISSEICKTAYHNDSYQERDNDKVNMNDSTYSEIDTFVF